MRTWHCRCRCTTPPPANYLAAPLHHYILIAEPEPYSRCVKRSNPPAFSFRFPAKRKGSKTLFLLFCNSKKTEVRCTPHVCWLISYNWAWTWFLIRVSSGESNPLKSPLTESTYYFITGAVKQKFDHINSYNLFLWYPAHPSSDFIFVFASVFVESKSTHEISQIF